LFKKSNKVDVNYLPNVSLIVPCLNEEMTIAEKIKNSLVIDYPKDKLEIIIIDSSSTDKTAEIVKSFECPVCYENKNDSIECINNHKTCLECYQNMLNANQNKCPYCIVQYQ